jgi:hypothetical protein
MQIRMIVFPQVNTRHYNKKRHFLPGQTLLSCPAASHEVLIADSFYPKSSDTSSIRVPPRAPAAANNVDEVFVGLAEGLHQ